MYSTCYSIWVSEIIRITFKFRITAIRKIIVQVNVLSSEGTLTSLAKIIFRLRTSFGRF